MTTGGSNIRSKTTTNGYRNFDGKRYHSIAIVDTKSYAQKRVDELREEGFLARYTETKSGYSTRPRSGPSYLIWIRRK